MKRSQKSLRQLLNRRSRGSLQPLLAYADYLGKQTEKLRTALGAPLSQHVALANIHGQTAIILVGSPSWLARARYAAPLIIDQLNRQGLKISKLNFKMDPHRRPRELPKRAPAMMSADTSQLLENTAATIEDKALRQALLRLANHGRNHGK